jgi:hypothetical protein
MLREMIEIIHPPSPPMLSSLQHSYRFVSLLQQQQQQHTPSRRGKYTQTSRRLACNGP